jgi:hypothetical protein
LHARLLRLFFAAAEPDHLPKLDPRGLNSSFGVSAVFAARVASVGFTPNSTIYQHRPHRIFAVHGGDNAVISVEVYLLPGKAFLSIHACEDFPIGIEIFCRVRSMLAGVSICWAEQLARKSRRAIASFVTLFSPGGVCIIACALFGKGSQQSCVFESSRRSRM